MSLTYSLRQLRQEFQLRTNNATLQLVGELEKKHGFPRRLPMCSPPRWSAPAVDYWFEHWDLPREKITGENNVIVQLRETLERKYA